MLKHISNKHVSNRRLPLSYQKWLDQAKASPEFDEDDGSSFYRSYSRAGSEEVRESRSSDDVRDE